MSIDLLYNIDGTDSEDLSVLDRDLVLSTRRKVGSYEARPAGLIQRPLHVNDDFRNLSQGWERTSTSTSQAFAPWNGTLPAGYMRHGSNNLAFANDSLSDEDMDGNAWSLVTNQNQGGDRQCN